MGTPCKLTTHLLLASLIISLSPILSRIALPYTMSVEGEHTVEDGTKLYSKTWKVSQIDPMTP
jgi:hypothetical protein